ncbi:MAG: hypothetical protein WA981_15485 [Glaciecola sp.]
MSNHEFGSVLIDWTSAMVGLRAFKFQYCCTKDLKRSNNENWTISQNA